MSNQQLLDYIRTELAKGVPPEQIRTALLQSGWLPQDVNNALLQFTSQQPAVNQQVQPQMGAQAAQPQNIAQLNQAPTGDKDNRSLITILLLLFVYPVGILVMWVWAHWKTWIKIVVTLPIVIGVILFVASIVFGGSILLFSKPQVIIEEKTTITSPVPQSETFPSQSEKERASCFVSSDCPSGSCVSVEGSRVCSEGNIGDPCFISSDCKSNHCPNKICTAGNQGDACFTSFDCENDLSCSDSTCQ